MKTLHFRAMGAALLTFSSFIASAVADSSSDQDGHKKEPTAPKPCTIRSPSSGHFFDLNSITMKLPDAKDKKSESGTESWRARGYDYGTNFTLNFCAPVVETQGKDPREFEGIDKDLWRNVSAYYTDGKRSYSIGQQNSDLVFRGSKLVLNYTNGSPCNDESQEKHKRSRTGFDHDVVTLKTAKRRKSTIISLLCQKDAAPNAPRVSVSFVGASQDHCTYFFEARSTAACAGIETTPSQLSPGGVFGVILVIAAMVYFVGGCVYQRTVMNQRGWKQLPNYSMWAGIWNFFSDISVILFSSCTRFLPGRRGYSRLSLNGNSNIRGRHSEDENRLIDELDESWDD